MARLESTAPLSICRFEAFVGGLSFISSPLGVGAIAIAILNVPYIAKI